MPDFESEGFDLIRAGDFAAANAFHAAGWPLSINKTIAAGAQYALLVYQGSSGSSMTIGTGTKVFTLDSPRGWKAGTPVRIMDVNAPSTNFMQGTLSVDESSEGVVTANVTDVKGTGTFTLWTIILVDHATTVASPPVGEADGGTAASTFAGARANLEVIRIFDVLSVLSTPPGSPITGDQHIVGDAPTGAWAANENDIARWNGASWDFITPVEGEGAYDRAQSRAYLYTDEEWFTGGLWGGSKWRHATPQTRSDIINVASTSRTITVQELTPELLIKCDPVSAGGLITLSLPHGSTTGVLGAVVNIINISGGSGVTVNVLSGGQINGAASLSLPSQYNKTRLIAGESGGGAPRWFILG